MLGRGMGLALLFALLGLCARHIAAFETSAESLLLLVPSTQLQTIAPKTIPSLPSWAQEYRVEAEDEGRQASWHFNREVVARSDALGQPLDFVLLGDSMAANIRTLYPNLWKQYWGDLEAAPLGVGGNTVEELTWRLALGGERFALPPRVAAVWIGHHNLAGEQRVFGRDPAPKLDFLLQWLRAAWPTTHLLVLNVLPSTAVPAGATAAANAEYRALAAKWGASYSTCGSQIDPHDASQLVDGWHPAEGGYERVLGCLRRQRDALAARDREL